VQLAIVADTHLPRGKRLLPQGCLQLMRAADLILHAGDLSTVDVLRMLEALGPPVAAVHGNVDAPDLRALLPATRIVDAVVFGHSHMPLYERADDGFQIFNPGSPTDRRRQPRHTMGFARVCARGKLEFELVEL
jgi:predicted phosphodiesterase